MFFHLRIKNLKELKFELNNQMLYVLRINRYFIENVCSNNANNTQYN